MGRPGKQWEGGESGDDIGQQLIFNLGDLVLQRQFAFFQPLDLQKVAGPTLVELGNDVIKVLVFALEFRQPLIQLFKIVHGLSHHI